jgi:exonuclease SbcC
VAELSEEIRDAEKVIGRLGGMEKKPKLQEDLSILQKILNILKKAEELQELPKIKDLKGLEVILGEDKTLHQLKNILEKPVKPFKVGELESLEQSLNELNKLLGEREALLRSAETNIKQLQEEIEKLENARRELARASEFYDLLLKIREKIYHRDGPVIKSIRTWVLTNVSSRAANYLSLFDVRVSDIRLEEKGRGISFECSYGGRKVDSKRLSGGEKVALALAIRLAISDVLGAKKFGFFILDEPTVHLDSENKKKLQEVFASLGRALRQTIIITHDEEVFEDADAMIIKFDRGTAPNAPSEVSVFRAFP